MLLPTSSSAPSPLTLYYAPGACSLAVHIALREVGVPLRVQDALRAEGLLK